MKLVLLWLSVFLSMLLAACGNYNYPRKLTTADSLMDALPDSAPQIFNGLSIGSNPPESHRMYYELLRIKAKDKAGSIAKCDSSIVSILHYYEDGGDESLLPQAYYYAGRYNAELHDAPQALDYFQKALDHIPDNSHTKLKSVIASQMGYLYNLQGLNSEAARLFRLSYKYACLLKDTLGMMYGLNDIGDSYGFDDNADSALYYCRQSLQLIQSPKYKLYQAGAASQVARFYNMAGKYEEALPYVRQSLSTVCDSADYRAIISVASKTYHCVGKEDSAMIYYNKLQELDDIYAQHYVHRELADHFTRTNQPDIAVSEIKKYLAIDDSLVKIKSTEAVARFKEAYNYHKWERKTNELQIQKRDTEHRIILTVVCVVFIIVTSTLYVRHTIQKKGKAYYKQKFYKLSFEILPAKTDNLLNMKNSMLYQRVIKEINDGCECHHFTKNDWKSLRSDFEKYDPKFLMKLSDLCRMNEFDQQVCMLIRLRIPVKNIAEITLHSSSSVSMSKKKLYELTLGEEGSASDWDLVIQKL